VHHVLHRVSACASFVLMSVKAYWRDRDMVAESVPPKASRPGVGAAGSQKPTRVRMEFPETWLWSDSVTGYLLA